MARRRTRPVDAEADPATRLAQIDPFRWGLRILLEDGPVLAVDKPAGLLTQGAVYGNPPSVESLVKAYLKQAYQKPGNVYLGVPHRLDRPVSGVLLFARNSKAAARLSEQFHARRVRKIYWALVEDAPAEPAGVLVDFLRKIPGESRAELTDSSAADARECSLSYRILEQFPSGTVLEIQPGTGRMHQIRLQLASRGWPIVGDRQYGARSMLPSPPPEGRASEPIGLHARRLTFLHPIRYEELTVEAPLPRFWPAEVRGSLDQARGSADQRTSP
jgi:23S rRNA pseudouridine1911/1915/1917 synthase